MKIEDIIIQSIDQKEVMKIVDKNKISKIVGLYVVNLVKDYLDNLDYTDEIGDYLNKLVLQTLKETFPLKGKKK